VTTRTLRERLRADQHDLLHLLQQYELGTRNGAALEAAAQRHVQAVEAVLVPAARSQRPAPTASLKAMQAALDDVRRASPVGSQLREPLMRLVGLEDLLAAGLDDDAQARLGEDFAQYQADIGNS
jgi:hypothetical protein